MTKLHLSVFLFFSLIFNAWSQNRATVSGTIIDILNKPLESVNVRIEGLELGTSTDADGNYELSVPAGENVRLIFSYIGFRDETVKLNLNQNEEFTLDITMISGSQELDEISILERSPGTGTMTKIDPKNLDLLPGTSGGGVEDLVKLEMGVSTRNELSSQYSVRGGNFDENLVYVNGIEIYRPFLVRAGQQEGLSFINSDMVSSIQFSAGGFNAQYGDKMSSVLDIEYRMPAEFGASVSASLLGASATIEDVGPKGRLSHISSFRYKTNQYLLGSLDTKGAYDPEFIDIQSNINWKFNDFWRLSFLANYAGNTYNFVPQDRETSFGTLNNAKSLRIYFDGQEMDQFITTQGALSLIFEPNDGESYQLTAGAYRAREEETYDILGQYWLNEVETDLGKNNFGDSILNIGVGTFLNHARNELEADVITLSLDGKKTSDKHSFRWGLKFRNEKIRDEINEWIMRDSSGYSLPYDGQNVGLYYVRNTNISIESQRFTAFLQDNYRKELDWATLNFTAGIRAHYWTYNEEFFVSPRLSLSLQPNWKSDWQFRLAAGSYNQAPFYKELRNRDGDLNPSVKSQKSWHFVAGADYYFNIWDRPFKFTTELYYKQFNDLVPYVVDNVRIDYLALNNASGFAEGIDFRLFGEFVPGVDSWITMSFLKTSEDIIGDEYSYVEDTLRYTVQPGHIPRPSDQRFNLSIYFQDYLPGNESNKVNLSLHYGSGLPFGPPKGERYQATLRMPPYRRVDIGFSKLLRERKPDDQRFLKSLWISAELFNVLDIDNTISYTWVTDIYDRQYAVPNYLTGRRLNIRLKATF